MSGSVLAAVLEAQADALETQARTLRALAAAERAMCGDEWLTVSDAVTLSGRSGRTLRKVGAEGAFEMRGSRRALLIRRSSLVAWLEAQPLRCSSHASQGAAVATGDDTDEVERELAEIAFAMRFGYPITVEPLGHAGDA